MPFTGKVREAVDRVSTAATDTKQAVTVIGLVAAAALGVALVALLVASRRRA